MATGRRMIWKAPPESALVIPQRGAIYEVRWELDPEDPKKPIVKRGTCRLVRAPPPDLDILFENDPANLIRYGYRFLDAEGNWTIVGDLTLFDLMPEDQYERERIQQIARGIGVFD